jgi:hypothetical protein
MAKVGKKFDKSIILKETTTAAALQGEIRVDSADDKLKIYLDSAERSIVSENQSQTLTNKTIDVDNNTVSNIEVDNLKSGVLDTDLSSVSGSHDTIPSAKAVKDYVDGQIDTIDQASEIIYSNATSGLAATNVQTAIDEVEARVDSSDAHIAASTNVHGLSGGAAVVGTTSSQALTNKTIDADSNTITNIDNNDIKASAAIDASKIADGTVSNAEFQFINSLTSNAQTQINNKADASALTSHTGASSGVHGVTGSVVGTSDTQTLTNKTVVAANNTITTASSGNLAATELNAALSELQSDIDSRALDSALTSHTGSTTAHGATGAVVGTTNTQTLTNKTLTSPAINGGDVNLGTASNSSKIVVSKDTFANINALTKEEASVYYATDAKKLYVDDGTSLIAVGTGSGGGVNYLSSNPDFEINATGYVAYADAAGASPVDGTGGSPVTTIVRSTSSPLRGTASGLWSKSAANRQGEGFADAFTIDTADQGKVLQISFDYTTSTNFVDGDMRMFIYDVTNAVIIEPSQRDILANSGQAKYTGYFQASSNSVSYRVIWHVATVSALAYDFKLDNVSVGPIASGNAGTFISDWVKYTSPTTQGFGTVSSDDIYWRRNGSSLEMFGRFTAGTVTATQARITYPNSLLPNSTVFNQTQIVGRWWRNTGAATNRKSSPLVADTNGYLRFTNDDYTAAVAPTTSLNGDACVNTGDVVLFHTIGIPIQGWSTGVSASEISSLSTIAFKLGKTGTQSIATAAATKVTLTTIDSTFQAFDIGGGSDPTNSRWVCPESGLYWLAATLATNATDAGTGTIGMIYKNGAAFLRTDSAPGTVAGNGHFICGQAVLVKGDIIELYSATKGGDASYNVTGNAAGADERTYLEGFKINNPAQIAPTEFVGCSYESNAGQNITHNNDQIVVYEDVRYDSTNSYNSSTGIYTVPVSGKYFVTARITYAATAQFSGTEESFLSIRKNASGVIRSVTYPSSASVPKLVDVNGLIDLVKGDTIEVRAYQFSSVTLNLSTSVSDNCFSITKVS